MAAELLPLGAMIIDIDQLSMVTGWYGFTVGDEALVVIARVLVGLRPDSASVYRVRGDEFALLVPRAQHLDRLAATIERPVVEETSVLFATRPPILDPGIIGPHPEQLSLSIGAATIDSVPSGLQRHAARTPGPPNVHRTSKGDDEPRICGRRGARARRAGQIRYQTPVTR